jgi:Ni,Fe-hydrogenase III large subunit
MSILGNLTDTERVESHRPWPRVVVNESGWRLTAGQLAKGERELVALWGEKDSVHLAIRCPAANEFAVLSLVCVDGTYPSLSQFHPPALRLERAIRDLYGLVPEGLPDERPWLDHGRWGIKHPLAIQPNVSWPPEERATQVAPLGVFDHRADARWLGGPAKPGHDNSLVSNSQSSTTNYAFLPATGDSLHQVAVGPVHAGIIEPGFFQFTASGEIVVRLEERLGYVHKGIESLMTGADLEHGTRLAGRVSGDSTVAYAFAFARAVEAALGIEAPPRAQWLRALMGEIERIANHLGDFGAICNDASFAIMQAQCAILRERVLRAAGACFGHRLMRDCIRIGGVAVDLSADAIAALSRLAMEIGLRLPRLTELYDKTASLQDRTVGAGFLSSKLARQYACGGFVGRASGREFDARKAIAYPPFDRIAFEAPVLEEGDVNARVWIRIREIEQSVSIVRQILDRLPAGPLRIEFEIRPGEGVALVEGFRGDIFASVRIGENGAIERCHLRDQSWFQWPLLEAASEGNIVADFPLCNKSFNCSYSGHEL